MPIRSEAIIKWKVKCIGWMIVAGIVVGCEKAPVEAVMELHDAAEAGDLVRCQALIAGGTAIDARDRAGRTALHAAVAGGCVECRSGRLSAGPRRRPEC